MTERGDRFLCMLALEALCEFGVAALAKKLETDFPQAELKITARQLGCGPMAGAMLDFGDGAVMIAAIDAPIPPVMIERAYALNRTWPEAREELARHKAHLVVSNRDVARNFEDALVAAAQVTLTAAALSEMVPCLGLYWETAETVTEPGEFRRQAAPVQAGQRAAAIWTQLQLLDGPPAADDRKTVAAISYGLRPFIGREVELQPTTMQPLEAGKRLIGAIDMSLTRCPVLKHGDTFGLRTSKSRMIETFAHHQV